ncbi:carbon-nitrogen hydrolase family protein [Arthrobacter sp. B6]|uniref:carbon-nitrogen hydrolase family protein n=1 Tax=Arthrobacter sp. B6 TaxID=1570137 RepID=UPI0009EE33DB|nr:carbon-nitrogen hydrolase family protein [Arthrobacter sp. B6]
MQRTLPLIAAQARPRLIGEPVSAFADEVKEALQAQPHTKLVVFPELHLFGDENPDLQRIEMLQESAEPLDGPRVKGLIQLAKDLNIWLVPGSVCERGPEGQLFNTQLILSPEGELAGYYRKIFPWRPFEPYDPGDKFTIVDLPGIGRVGLNICYDAWYPEVSRQLAWMGAEVIINVVKTTTPDRKQELILAKANAIVNQVFVVSVNCAGPTGKGQSIIVDPEGNTLAEAPDDASQLLTAELDLAAIDRVRTHGTENLNRPWSQFREGEAAVELSVYQGRINPATWTPPSYKP